MDYDNDTPKKGFTVSKLLKYLFIALILFVYAAAMLRICTSRDPSEMVKFLWTQDSIELYASSSENFSVLGQKPVKNIDDDGLFAVSGIAYMPETGEFQVTVRYNNSTVKKIMKEYSLADTPKGEVFVYVLEDASGKTYSQYSFTEGSRGVYNYRRLIFNDMNFIEAGTLTLKMYYIDDVTLSRPMTSLLVFDGDMDSVIVKTEPAPAETDKVYGSPAYLVNEEAPK